MSTLERLRKQLDLTQAQVAARVRERGLPRFNQATISAFERGRVKSPRPSSASALAAALETDPATIRAACAETWRKRRARERRRHALGSH